MQNSSEKMQQIVKKYTPEIYIQTKQFYGLITDVFPNEEIGDLLKIVVEKKGSIEVYQLIKNAVTQNYDQLQLVTEYRKILDKISKKTFIDITKLLPATDLLCIGLNYSIPISDNVVPAKIHDNSDPKFAKIKEIYGDVDDDLFDLINGIYNSGGKNDDELFNYIKWHKCFAGATDDVLLELKNGLADVSNHTQSSHDLIALQNYAKKLTNLDIPLIPKTPSLHFTIENNVIMSYNAKSNDINIPNTVYEIYDEAFLQNHDISTVIIPETVTKIGNAAFMECPNLKEVHLSSSITTINKSTFNSCYNLQYINLKYIMKIEDKAFLNCQKLQPDIINYINRLNPKALII